MKPLKSPGFVFGSFTVSILIIARASAAAEPPNTASPPLSLSLSATASADKGTGGATPPAAGGDRMYGVSLPLMGTEEPPPGMGVAFRVLEVSDSGVASTEAPSAFPARVDLSPISARTLDKVVATGVMSVQRTRELLARMRRVYAARWQTDFDLKSPTFKHDQELIGGGETNVAQFRMKARADTLFGGEEGGKPFRLFLENENRISTNQKDRDSGIKFRVGIARGLPGHPGQRVRLTGDLITNQLVSDSTYVLGLRYALTEPKSTNRRARFLNTRLYAARYLPDIQVGLEYRNRFQVDPWLYRSDGKKDVISLRSSAKWEHIRLFPPKDRERLFAHPGVEMDLEMQGWFFPKITTFSGSEISNTKGQFEVGVTIPFRVALTSAGKTLLERDGTFAEDTRALAAGLGIRLREAVGSVRVGYRLGAEETNGFQPDNSIQLGLNFKIK